MAFWNRKKEETPGTESQNPSGAAPESAASSLFASEAVEEERGFFARLKAGLFKTRNQLSTSMDALFTESEIDEDFYEELEEILIMGDVGVTATGSIIERLRSEVEERHLKRRDQCRAAVEESIRLQMRSDPAAYDFETKQSIVLVIGVNGVGKTTTIGKLASKLKSQGKKVLIAAADTFRAAAADQLEEWARRADVPIVTSSSGADPASVVYDAVTAAKARGVDVLLIDTAGRLHNKKNLMDELAKMNRIIDREYPDAHRENLIVLDAATGQNALVQAREFGDVANLTGIILTKMDGTAKGGIVIAIQSELEIPVKYIGVGEKIEDLQKFDPQAFVSALFDR
ncbi:MAG: signal recognition particle-docking protein FtsY [Lachnospiraceae bacterium]|nr:signal recognition particle-docking protein FtsY [Lachnospiraceae bacterium]MCR5477193.1 signal recognition particle-docking protein FtsY [Lachnospiraceae bacterium]